MKPTSGAAGARSDRARRPAGHRSGWRGWCARAAAGVLLSVAVVGALARSIATTWLPAVAVAAVAPFLLAGAPLAALVSLLARARVLLGAALVVTVVAAAFEVPLYLPASAQPGDPVTMLTANLRHGTADPHALVHLVRTEHVDIVTFEELNRAEAARLRAAGLDGLLPYHAVQLPAASDGVGIWSRYRIAGTTPHPRFRLGALSARLVLGSGPDAQLSVVAAHVLAPVADGAQRWARELARLRGVLARQPAGPVLAGGDFNATDDHVRFRRLLTGGYHDAAAQAGAGVVRTFPADQPYPALIGIDHVLTRGTRAVTARTVPLPGSDHRGLLVRVTLPSG